MSVTERSTRTSRVDIRTATQPRSALFAVDVDDRAGGTVLKLRGELDAATKPLLDAALGRVDNGVGPIVLDLSDLTFIDASSVGLIHRSRQRAVDRGTDLFLSSPKRHVLRVLQLTGLETQILC